jgi:SAM-dependent methyltransferase
VIERAVVDVAHPAQLPLGDLGDIDRTLRSRPHPAQFTDSIIEHFAVIVGEYSDGRPRVRVLAPFAGVGGIHKIPELLHTADIQVDIVGVEIEPAWACAHGCTLVGNALALPFTSDSFDFVMTSPSYGNRMADHHNARDGSKRITYRHYYGEDLHEDNSGTLQWSHEYREFHHKAWAEALRVLKPGGLFIVNVSNHIRRGVVQKVVEWHMADLLTLGLGIEYVKPLHTPRMRQGANAHLRVDFEHILVMRKNGCKAP